MCAFVCSDDEDGTEEDDEEFDDITGGEEVCTHLRDHKKRNLNINYNISLYTIKLRFRMHEKKTFHVT